MNSAGSYVVEAYYPVPKVERLCFDATESFHHPGRYINHVARRGNVRLSRPLYIWGKWRIGFLAIRDISAGEDSSTNTWIETASSSGSRKEGWSMVGS